MTICQVFLRHYDNIYVNTFAKMKKVASEMTLHYILCMFARKFIQHIVRFHQYDAEIKNGEGLVILSGR